jgi:heat shock protein HtpX
MTTASAMTASVPTACPRCTQRLARPRVGDPWCAGCEWNLNAYPRHRFAPPGGRWFDRLDFRLAYRRDTASFQARQGSTDVRAQWTGVRILLIVVSCLLVLTCLACFAVGGWLVGSFGVGLGSLLAMPLIGLAILLRPRVGRMPSSGCRLPPETMPSLFALIGRVADAVGTTAPDVLTGGVHYNAHVRRSGARQRRILELGLPLWLTLPPAARVALLAHELGHDVNGDPLRGLFVRPALTTFATLARATRLDESTDELTTTVSAGGLESILRVVLWLISRGFALIHLGIMTVAAPDHQRAEYEADALAVRVAGTEGALLLLDRLVLRHDITRLIDHAAETRPPADWALLASRLQNSRSQDLPAMHQLTRRSTSLQASHPPSGLRAGMVQSWPSVVGEVALTDEESARIDDELRDWYAALHRDMLGTRGYRGTPA